VQFRFTDDFPSDTLQLPGTSSPGSSKPSFKIRRAKTQFEGWLVWKELTYEIQIGWAGSDSGTAQGTTFSGLEDAYLDWDISKRGLFRVRGGQFKVPFGRQEYTSSERQQFADRSILSGEFTLSRDVGIQLWGATEKSRVAWALGAFNGNQRNKPANDNDKLQWNARLTFQPFGDVGYSEGDFESKDGPLLAVEGELQHNDQHGVTNANDFRDRTFGLNAVLKWRGLSVFAEHFWRQRTPETGAAFDSNGYIAQAGFFLVGRRLEVATRYAAWDPSNAVAGNVLSEWGAALNYYLRGHKLKATGDFRRLRDEGRDETGHELRLQVQAVF
jgi:phosphate-selective porin